VRSNDELLSDPISKKMPLDDSRKCKNGQPYTFVLITHKCREELGANMEKFKQFLKQYCPKGLKDPVVSEEPYKIVGTPFHAVLSSKEAGFRWKVNRLFTASNKSALWKGMNFHNWRDLRGKGDHAAQIAYCEKYLKNPSKDKVLGTVEEVQLGDPPHYAETMAYIQGVISRDRAARWAIGCDSRGRPSALHESR